MWVVAVLFAVLLLLLVAHVARLHRRGRGADRPAAYRPEIDPANRDLNQLSEGFGF